MNKAFEPTNAELISVEGRFHVLAESMPQLVWSAQADGTVDYFNRQWIAYTGLTVEAAAGRSLKGVVHPDDLARMWELWDKAIQTSEPYEIEYRLRCAADGSYKWFIARAMPLLNNEGKAVRWIGTATDIDEQKRAIESERYTTAILQRALLPSLLPNSKGLRFDAVYLQASKNAEVGGDWYDAIELDDGAVVISIGDVTGKGLEAAVIMNKVRHAMDIVPLHERNPEKFSRRRRLVSAQTISGSNRYRIRGSNQPRSKKYPVCECRTSLPAFAARYGTDRASRSWFAHRASLSARLAKEFLLRSTAG